MIGRLSLKFEHLYLGDFQAQHHWRFELANLFAVGTVLCIARCLAVSLVSRYQMPEVPLSQLGK